MSKFAALALNPAGRMLIVHPVTKKPLVDRGGQQAYIDLHSADSEAARKWRHALTNKRLDAKVARMPSAEETEAEAFSFLAAMTTGWYLLDTEGQPIDVPFTADNAAELYREVPWLRDQVDAYLGDRANFWKASSQS